MDRTRSRGTLDGLEPISRSNGNLREARAIQYSPDILQETRDTPLQSTSSRPFTDYETISDRVGHRNKFNGCSHSAYYPFKVGCDLACHYDDLDPTPPSSNKWYTLGRDLGHLSGNYSLDAHISSWPSGSFDPINWAGIVGDVGTSLDGRMKAGMNCLVELVQLGQTVAMIKNPYGLLKKDWRKTVKNLTASSLVKAGANIWLEKRYGWDNLWRDVKATALARTKVDAHIRHLKSSLGNWTSIGKSQQDVDTPNTILPTWGNISNSYQMQPTLHTIERRATFSADIYRDDAYRMWSEGKLFQDYFGTNAVAEALWDLVPFSFCADWFINIASWLERDPISWGQHRLRQMGYSVETRWTASLNVVSRARGWIGYSDAGSYYPPQCIRKSYVRTPGFPSGGSTAGLFEGLNLVHLADSAALVAQRIL